MENVFLTKIVVVRSCVSVLDRNFCSVILISTFLLLDFSLYELSVTSTFLVISYFIFLCNFEINRVINKKLYLNKGGSRRVATFLLESILIAFDFNIENIMLSNRNFATLLDQFLLKNLQGFQRCKIFKQSLKTKFKSEASC